ncbi:MAG: aminoacyl-tRNA deacylase [Bacteriovoracales bacterium]|jgi:Ala-tRNA(Pro) deacylase
MGAKKLEQLLEKNHIKYKTIKHDVAYTAQEIAEKAHIKGNEFAKTVMVKLDGKLAMAVLRGNDHLDLERLKKSSKAKKVEMVKEDDFQKAFPDCELGAMPPFGNLYNLNVYVDDQLSQNKRLAFNSGNHKELISLTYMDWEKLVHPKKADIHNH